MDPVTSLWWQWYNNPRLWMLFSPFLLVFRGRRHIPSPWVKYILRSHGDGKSSKPARGSSPSGNMLAMLLLGWMGYVLTTVAVVDSLLSQLLLYFVMEEDNQISSAMNQSHHFQDWTDFTVHSYSRSVSVPGDHSQVVAIPFGNKKSHILLSSSFLLFCLCLALIKDRILKLCLLDSLRYAVHSA